MTPERSTGVVLRTRPLTETSLVVHWLTPEFGRVATVARGARRPKSPFRGRLDLFHLAEFSFHRSRRSSLHTLREVVLRETFPAVREDYPRLRQAAYCALLLEQATETDTPLPGLYALFVGVLANLAARPASSLNVLAFEFRLLRELGLTPDLARSPLTPGAQKLLAALHRAEEAVPGVLALSGAQTREIARFLAGLLLDHLERLPRGRAGALDPSREPATPAS